MFFCDVKKYIREHYLEFKKETLTNIKIPISNKLTKKTSGLLLNYFYLVESDRHKRDMLITNFCMSVGRNVDLLWDHIGKDCFIYIEGEDELKIYMLTNELMYLSAIFSISWICPSLKDVIEEGRKKYGTYGLLYEGEMTNYGKQLLLIMKKLSSKIQRNVIEEESDYWRIKNPFVYRYLEECNLEDLIIGI